MLLYINILKEANPRYFCSIKMYFFTKQHRHDFSNRRNGAIRKSDD
jgi:hypothetical protein